MSLVDEARPTANAERDVVTDAAAWRAVTTRDAAGDGRFVYAVQTTGIYCRPSCPSRRPRRANVRFFGSPLLAERAGFRACRRCQPDGRPDVRLEVVRVLCEELRRGKRPLAVLARRGGYSVAQVKRLFDELLGVSPAQFADACRLERLKHELRATDSVALALYGAGFSTPSQVHGQPALLGMTPGAYAKGGADHVIHYTSGPTRFGRLMLGATAQGVCSAEFGDDDVALERSLAAAFPRAKLVKARPHRQLGAWFSALGAWLDGRRPHPDLPLDVRATAFQRQVYRALLEIPRGQTRTYAQVATAVGRPGAARAVARACATNQIAGLIPCHRVLREGGALAGYRWGLERKQALLEAER